MYLHVILQKYLLITSYLLVKYKSREKSLHYLGLTTLEQTLFSSIILSWAIAHRCIAGSLGRYTHKAKQGPQIHALVPPASSVFCQVYP